MRRGTCALAAWVCVLGMTVLEGTSRGDLLYVSVDGSGATPGAIDTVGAGGVVNPFVSGLPLTTGMAFALDGSLYIATTPSGAGLGGGGPVTIEHISAQRNVTSFVPGIPGSYLHGLAFDTAGNLYVGLGGIGIEKVKPSGQASPFGTALGQGVAFDSK